MKLTTTIDPRIIEEHYQREGTLLAFEIPVSTPPPGLRTIAQAHAGSPQRECVLQMVVAHRSCDDTTLALVCELAEGSAAVLNAVATSGKASRTLLRQLARSPHVSVREHAELALVDQQLRDADDDGIAQVYQQHRDHPTWGYDLRYRLVSDPRTPHSVLSSIASYRDPIALQAQRRLGVKATG